MRAYLIILSILFVFSSANGQEIKLKPFIEKRSSYYLTEKFEPFKKNVLDSICKEFNVKKIQNSRDNNLYTFKVGMSQYWFSVLDTKIKFDTTFTINQYELNKTYFKGDSIGIKGFLVESAEGKKMCKKFSKILLSAYLQEYNSSYNDQQQNFLVLPLKSNSEFWKRNFINIGYGMSYATKNNPFTTKNGLGIGFGYIWEALHYIPIFASPFYAQNQNDKVLIPLIGLTNLLIWKTIIYGFIIGRPIVKNYNRLAKMKYKIPKSIFD